ncbi:MAG: glycosyltransferase family 4 protein [Chloroflexi bacterium]|nr:glycosyltransferase family 4 protein [Chloroflexota bacterium]
MRIGIDVTSALTQGGGIGRYTRELVRALVALDGRSTYHLFAARQTGPTAVPHPLPTGPHIRRHTAPLTEPWLYRLWYRLRIPAPVQWVTGPLDLFHSPDFVLPPVSGGIPTLLTVHDLSFVHYPEVYPAVLVNYLNRVVPWSIGRASHILADSAATKADLIAVWQVPEAKITVLYSGVHEQFQPVTEQEVLTAVTAHYQLDDAPYFLTVGTVQPRKNYQMLIRAFAPVAAEWPHNLVIAGGKGWLYDDMLAEVARQGLNGRVRFTGFVADEDLPALYSGATLFLFPSLYEGFGLPLLEAMQCGVPVVTSDASSLPEVVGGKGNGETAVLLSPHDSSAWTQAMQTLLADPARRARLVAAGYRQARQFTWRKAAAQLLNLYQSLAHQPSERAW